MQREVNFSGATDSLLQAAQFVEVLETRTGLKIACLEEIAWVKGWIDGSQMDANIAQLGKSSYGAYLSKLSAKQ